MTDAQLHITYTAKDLERYHKGMMNAAEMHAIEKAALDDPFLADALDGYALAGEAQDDLSALQTRLGERTGTRSPARVFAFDRSWLRVAAALILLGGMSYLAYWKFGGQEPLSLAKQETAAPTNTVDAVVAATDNLPEANRQESDTITLAQNATQLPSSPGVPALKPQSEQVFADDRSVTQAAPVLSDQKTTAEQQADFRKDMGPSQAKVSMAQQKYLLRGKVTDPDGNPVPNATVAAGKNQAIVNTDVDGNFAVPMSDSVILANISAVGYASVNRNLNSQNVQNMIVLPSENKQLSEVVVSGNGAKKKSASAAAAKTVSAAEMEKAATRTELTEAIAAKQFLQFVADSMRRQSLPSANVTGSVSLSFEVKRNGRPVRVRVDKSLCAACDAEAIRLLSSGPAWPNSKGKRLTTVVNF